uniref:RNA-binding protein rnp24 n=1 Tax=Kwoniella dejecticola CBS 10117 TaxID=1296121 RepID=A0A1A5ZVU2_9TREE|nr:RNA-binding protein rnp24 [Kwoniella dejecticola CBS 10117]OBR81925.1 RNA-binding protein rnp24 [Kwoniella dejecticola CBS 10117]
MSEEASSSSKKVKSGRTREQQAARDARKAAKLAAKAAATPDQPVTPSEESPAVAKPVEGAHEDGEPSNKRKRVIQDGEELEIDVNMAAPLSKAEMRLQRKKAKRGEEAKPVQREYEKPDKPLKEKEKGSKDKEESNEAGEKEIVNGVGGKRQNSIWIGNLAFKTTVESLTQFFENGITENGGMGNGSITRINLPKKNGRDGYAQNKGFAYVDFKTPELQTLAVGLSEKFFEGRKVLIKKGDDHSATPNARTPKPLSTKAEDLGSSSRRPETSSLYMGNLPFDATELAIRDLVEKSGLKKVRLGAFEDTGRCKGFAFLDFLSSRHAKVALANRKNHYFNGRRLTVEFASEEAAKRSGGKSKPKSDKPRKFYESTNTGEAGEGEGDVEAGSEVAEKKNDKRGKKWEVTGRPRPGAALAMAKRENVGIVEGSGSKITFD